MSRFIGLSARTLAALGLLVALTACGASPQAQPTATPTLSPTPEPTATSTLPPTATLTPTNTLTPTVTPSPTPAYVALPDDCTGAEIGALVVAEGTHISAGSASAVSPTEDSVWDFWQLSSDNGEVLGLWLYTAPIPPSGELIQTEYARIWIPVTDGSEPNHIRPATGNYVLAQMTLFLNDGTEVVGMDELLDFTVQGFLWNPLEPDLTEGTLDTESCEILVTTIE